MTIRENILFGKEFEKRKYAEIIKNCELYDDLQTFPAGD